LYGHAEVVSALAAKADINALTKDGWSALMLAAEAGKTECVKALLATGANTEFKDQRSGKTAFMHAVEAKRADVVSLLKSTHKKEL
jgi:serine/threonine-protein phosphatase 6 regulatory ankyrin repeat subunit B